VRLVKKFLSEVCQLLASILLFSISTAQAGTLTLQYNHSFGSVPADGPAPWLTAVFDDGGSQGTVSLTLSVANTIGAADITDLYYNLDPNLKFDNLTITRTGGSGPIDNHISVSTGSNSYKAGGDGWYDIHFDLPPSPGQDAARFNADETLTFDITGIMTLKASSFDFLSADGGGAGPFTAAAHVQSTGPSPFEESDWIAALLPQTDPPPTVPDSPPTVPVPATAWLFGSALGLLGWIRRRAA
jgi:hypothetical protein